MKALAGVACLALIPAFGPPARAQAPAGRPAKVRTLTSGYRKFSIDENLGAVFPQGAMRGWTWRNPDGNRQKLFKSTFLEGTHFGCRPIRYAQIDAGLDVGLGVAGKRKASVSRYEQKELSDLIFMAPVGVRGVAPLFDERLLISGGGGGNWVSNLQYRGDFDEAGKLCDPCSSRHGWGRYGVAQVLYVFGESRRIGLGATARWTQAKLSPGWLPSYGARGIGDSWLFAGLALSIRI